MPSMCVRIRRMSSRSESTEVHRPAVCTPETALLKKKPLWSGMSRPMLWTSPRSCKLMVHSLAFVHESATSVYAMRSILTFRLATSSTMPKASRHLPLPEQAPIPRLYPRMGASMPYPVIDIKQPRARHQPPSTPKASMTPESVNASGSIPREAMSWHNSMACGHSLRLARPSSAAFKAMMPTRSPAEDMSLNRSTASVHCQAFEQAVMAAL
mmetsp:Transcript_30744/g.86217  ORF Transcript_30744/g.86217 Transcript_30744/m.86217 type:complete len:212 (-) Transcript_30744:479-1114(-)